MRQPLFYEANTNVLTKMSKSQKLSYHTTQPGMLPIDKAILPKSRSFMYICTGSG